MATELQQERTSRRGCSPPGERILMLMTRNQRRGAESFARVLAEELDRRGLNVSLLALAPAESGSALPVRVLGRRPLGIGTLVRLCKAIVRADLVIACGSTTLPASVIAGGFIRRPIIYQNIGDPLFWAGRGARHLRVRVFLRRMSAVAALSEESARVLESRFGVPPTRIRVIRNARSAAHFQPASPEQKRRCRRALGLDEDRDVVVIAGALSPEKRVDVAISAVARMHRDVLLAVVGDGPLRDELTRLASSVAPDRVTFLGQVEDLAPVLGAADAAVLTSESEGVPGVLIEAGLCGLPVVSTDVGYVREIVVPHRTGYLVATGDVEALAQSLEAALADSDRLGAAGREHCVARFDLAGVGDAWAHLVRVQLGHMNQRTASRRAQ